MSPSVKPRVLPADIYDTLELSALAYGGIGAERLAVGRANRPFCAMGHLWAASTADFSWDGGPLPIPVLAAWDAGIGGAVNDNAVRRINERKKRPKCSRVSFAEWCAELRVERADA